MSNSHEKRPIDLRTANDAVHLSVRVQPKASRDQILIEDDGRVRIKLTAPPAEGAANKALCALLAKRLGLPKRAVRVVHGEKSRDKVVAMLGISSSEVRRGLQGESSNR